jgi:UDP-GlcNAc:undecaprenyl-phosphate/decaprenyl-phosphate GlcNAc-1-phosphate transferase
MLVIGSGLLALQASAAEKPLETQKEKVSYAMAVAVAKSVQRQGVEIDVEIFARGLRDALAGGKLLLTEDEMRLAMSGVVAELKRKQGEATKAIESRKAAGEAFLAENRKKEGVVTLPSGLQYKILTKGEGKIPGEADTVECHYRGTLIDGREFDSSYRRGRPATFRLARVIPGWREALKLMPVGSKWQIFVPPELGYGARGGGRRSRIGPNETLVFDVHLVAIQPPIKPAAPDHKTATAAPAAETPAL